MYAQRNHLYSALARFVHESQKYKDFGSCITYRLMCFHFSIERLSEACVRACVCADTRDSSLSTPPPIFIKFEWLNNISNPLQIEIPLKPSRD